MDLERALDIVVAGTGHERFRELCSDGNRDRSQRDRYRALVMRMAGAESDPSWAERVASLAGAVARFAASGFKVRSPEEKDRVLAICRACEYWNPGPNRCRRCGCYLEFKARMEREHCPIGKW